MIEPEIILLLLAAGGLAGFIAGLFGVGGGIIVVPVSLWVLDLQGVGSDYVQHMAVGTSFLVMIFTTFSSSWMHYRKKALRMDVLRPMVPGIIFGSVLGGILAHYISSTGLQVIFIVFAYAMAVKTLLGFKPDPKRSLPGTGVLVSVAGLFGTISSMLGVGGGVFNVPFLLSCRVPVREAVGSSAALSWAIALTGALTYIISGFGAAGRPEGSLGFAYLPVALVLVITTSIFAPLGAKLAHRLPARTLQFIFGLLLIAITTQILFKWLI